VTPPRRDPLATLGPTRCNWRANRAYPLVSLGQTHFPFYYEAAFTLLTLHFRGAPMR